MGFQFDLVQIITAIILAVGSAAAIHQLIILRRQIEEIKKSNSIEQDWNRRRATQEYLYNIIAKDLPPLTQQLEKEFKVNVYDLKQTSDVIYYELNDDAKKDFELKLKTLFNMFELIAVGIKNSILDDEIAYQYGGFLFPAYWRWGNDFINRYQEKNRTLWAEYKDCAILWGKRMEKDLGRVVRPGKPPTDV